MKQKNKPEKTILIHACCAPDAAVVIERLSDEYNILICFYNPNIHPQKEYTLRLDEMVRIAEDMNVELVDCEYDDKNWFKLIRGLETEPEKGLRCDVCFEIRLRKTAEIARDKGIDVFTTVLTVSPHKNAQKINQIGTKLGKEYGVQFLEADFKKKDGFKRSIELSRQFGLYRQDYCGCLFSRQARQKHNNSETKS